MGEQKPTPPSNPFPQFLGVVALLLAVKVGGPMLSKAVMERMDYPIPKGPSVESPYLRTDEFLNDRSPLHEALKEAEKWKSKPKNEWHFAPGALGPKP